MATLPATTDIQTANPPAPISAANTAPAMGVPALLKHTGLLMAMAAAIGIAVAVLLWMQEPDFRPILADMQNVSATQAVDVLQANDIPYKIDNRSGALMVPAEHIHKARMQLASVGISDNPNVGFELLDKEQGLGTSQFMENISYRRGLEGELARTIASLQTVKSARVHLALPKASVFVRDSRKPSASVFVELMPGRSLREGQVAAIVNLVASSVPEMDSSDVAIVDQNGRLLSQQGQSDAAEVAAYQFDYTRKLEELLSKRVQAILSPVVGMDNFKAQVAADVDFTALEETAEAYNPDASVLRSEQTLDEQRSAGAVAGGVPGALSNQPPGAVAVPEQVEEAAAETANASGNSRRQATRNYELDRTISYTRHQQGKLNRLSVAVVVNNREAAAGGEGNTATADNGGWTQEELDRLTSLVRGAVGFDEARGDAVTVVNAPFAQYEVEEVTVEEPPIWEQAFFQKMVKQGLAVVIVLILIFAVIRPIMKSLSAANSEQKELQLAAFNAQQAAATAAATGQTAQELPPGQIPAQHAAATPLLPGPGQNYTPQLTAVHGVVADNPQRAAQVVRQWVTDNE